MMYIITAVIAIALSALITTMIVGYLMNRELEMQNQLLDDMTNRIKITEEAVAKLIQIKDGESHDC